jgi:FdhD protein
MPQECPTTLYLNDRELLTIQTTPCCLEDWARGFLLSEGLIGSLADLKKLVVDEAKGLVWADIEGATEAQVPEQRYLTSACGKGVTFSSIKDAMQLRPVRHGFTVTKTQLADWMRLMGKHTPLYCETGGMHAAMVVRAATGEFLVREDIGRHNAVDKALGAAFHRGWRGPGLAVLTSGRISYEMCSKLARHGIGVVASRTAATDQAGRLADQLGIDLVGYVRGNAMTVYTGGQRIQG